MSSVTEPKLPNHPSAFHVYAKQVSEANTFLETAMALHENHSGKKAARLYKEAAELYESAGSLLNLAHFDSNVQTTDSNMLEEQAHGLVVDAYAKAIVALDSAISIHSLERDAIGLADAYLLVGCLHQRATVVNHGEQNDADQLHHLTAAAKSFMLAAESCQAIQDHENKVAAYELSAKCSKQMALHLEKTKHLSIHMDSHQMLADTYMQMAKAYCLAKRPVFEARAYMKAANTCRDMNDPTNEVNAYLHAANAFRVAQHPMNQVEAYKLAVETNVAIGAFLPAGMLCEQIGQVLADQQQFITSCMYYEFADTLYRAVNDYDAARRASNLAAACEASERTLHKKALEILAKEKKSRKKTLQLQVRRSHLLLDSFHCIMLSTPQELRDSHYDIHFVNEIAQDYGGLSSEWFTLLSNEITSATNPFFISENKLELTYQPNPAKNDKKSLTYYVFIGRLVAMAINSGHLISCRLTSALRNHMLGHPLDWSDLQSFDPVLHDQYMQILTMSELSNLDDLYFEVSIGGALMELCPNGANMALTHENRVQYISLATNMYLRKSIENQLQAFLKGFHSVVCSKAIAHLNARALELLLNGDPVIRVKDWRQHTLYEGYTAESNVIVWFWNMVESHLSATQRTKLLLFVTGSPNVPVAGFSALSPAMTIARSDLGEACLPSVSTCYHRLLIPRYTLEQTLRDKFLYVIEHASLGFGLV